MGYLDIYLSLKKGTANAAVPLLQTYNLPGLAKDSRPTAEEIEQARSEYKFAAQEYKSWDSKTGTPPDHIDAMLAYYEYKMLALVAKYGEGITDDQSE